GVVVVVVVVVVVKFRDKFYNSECLRPLFQPRRHPTKPAPLIVSNFFSFVSSDDSKTVALSEATYAHMIVYIVPSVTPRNGKKAKYNKPWRFMSSFTFSDSLTTMDKFPCHWQTRNNPSLPLVNLAENNSSSSNNNNNNNININNNNINNININKQDNINNNDNNNNKAVEKLFLSSPAVSMCATVTPSSSSKSCRVTEGNNKVSGVTPFCPVVIVHCLLTTIQGNDSLVASPTEAVVEYQIMFQLLCKRATVKY
ncbi:hypothetical protein L249_7152, partial [Ophiocordyceps polyrhachis-furcata BCC 54312]